MGRHRIRALVGAVMVVAALVAVPGVAGAAPKQAMVRIAHFSPDAEYVDVYVVTLNRKQMFLNVFYKNVSAYWAVNAGPFTYEVRPAGVPANTPPVVRLTGDLKPGAAYTVVAVGKKTDLNAILLIDDLSPTGRDSTKVRFVYAAVDLPPLDIAVAGKVVSPKVSFPSSTGYQQLPTGTVRLEARKAGGADVLIRDELSLKAGTVNSVALIGGAGQPREAFRFADATGVRTMPSGALRTGDGGTATPSPAPGNATPAPAPGNATPAPPDASVSTASAKALSIEVAPLPSQVAVPGPPSPPVRVSIPAIGVRSSLVRLGLAPDGSMEVPVDYGRAGWFTEGTLPGETGPAVIAGHVDSKSGPAVFYRLGKLRRGDTIEVDRADGVRLRFVVEERAQYPKASFPSEAVYGPVPWAALRLVTCGGEFDRARRSYRDNVVVYARLAGSSR